MTASVVTALPLVRTARMEKDWLSRKEAANYLTRIGCAISAKTLANLASNNNQGRGPPFDRIGWKAAQYRRIDLDAWAAARRTTIGSR